MTFGNKNLFKNSLEKKILIITEHNIFFKNII